jgi:hypothetical protein
MTKKKIKLSNHIHLFKRIDLVPSWKSKLPSTHKFYRPSAIVLQCVKPECNYQLEPGRLIGKISECNRCHEPFIMSKISVSHVQPHCDSCVVRKAKPDLDKLSQLLDKI